MCAKSASHRKALPNHELLPADLALIGALDYGLLRSWELLLFKGGRLSTRSGTAEIGHPHSSHPLAFPRRAPGIFAATEMI
jgi:hypothetical protein